MINHFLTHDQLLLTGRGPPPKEGDPFEFKLVKCNYWWVVGKSDFNENPVVSLDLDLDLGFVNSASRVVLSVYCIPY